MATATHQSGRWPVLLLLLGLAAGGCARPDDWVETYPDVAARARRDPSSFATGVQARWDGLSGLVGSYQVRASRGINSRTLNTNIHLLRDRFVDLQVLAPTGSSEGYLVAGPEEVGFWASDENVLYRGANEPGAFGRALGLDLSPEQVVAVLMGFGLEADRVVAVEWDEAARRVRVSGGRTTAWLHPVLAHFDRVLVTTPSGPIEVDYQAWAEDGPPVPLRMTVSVPSEDIDLDLRLAPRWQADPRGLDRSFFEVYPVVGALEAPLSRLEAEGGLLRRGLER